MKIFKKVTLKWNDEKRVFEKIKSVSEEIVTPLALCDYAPGDDEVKEHCYFVFVRNHDGAIEDAWTSGISDITGASTKLKETGADWYSAAIVDYMFASNPGQWGIIGRLEEKPTAKTSAGKTINLESCDEKDLSEVIEVNLEHLQVNKGNYEQLRALARTGNVDMIFVEKTQLGSSAIEGIAISNIKMRVHLSITGNEKNSMPITAKKEVANSMTNMKIINVTGT